MEKPTVLIVDDEANIRRALRMVLDPEGYAVLEAESAERALEILAAEPVDLAVFDVKLPGMDGLTLLSRARELWRDLLVIVISGHADTSDVVEAVMRGDSPAMRKLREDSAKVAPTSGRVLVLGESGTGKELVAAEIHRQSKRALGPFVKVNCAAIPAELIESELFGHEKGS